MQYKYWFSYGARIVPTNHVQSDPNSPQPFPIQGHIEIKRVEPIDGMLAIEASAHAIINALSQQFQVPLANVQVQILNWRPFERASALVLPQGVNMQ